MRTHLVALAGGVCLVAVIPPATAVGNVDLSAPEIDRNSWQCRGTETLIDQSTPPSDLNANYEVQARMVESPPGKARFDWRTIASAPADDQPQVRCASYTMLPGGSYEWRMRELRSGAPGPWSPVSAPDPFYDRPDPVRWKWVSLKDIPTGLRVTWKYRGDTGGAHLTKYDARLRARTPVDKPRPTFQCADNAYRCTILNMIQGRRTYYFTLRVYNGHRWSRGAKFWVCAGRCD